MRRLAFLGLAAFAALLLAPGVMSSAAGRAPVIKYVDDDFGAILATPGKQALYYWNVEKRDFKIHCTGACAVAWPPLIVKTKAAVPRKIPGVSGVFGTIRRPGGRLQVTHRGLPIYTYAHEQPEQVLCNNVNGWFVVRLR